MRKSRKKEIITFKADAGLVGELSRMPNRSEFIRSAILAALDNVCPLCKGLGVLSPKQRVHWDNLSESHSVEECRDCHELVLVCSNDKK